MIDVVVVTETEWVGLNLRLAEGDELTAGRLALTAAAVLGRPLDGLTKYGIAAKGSRLDTGATIRDGALLELVEAPVKK